MNLRRSTTCAASLCQCPSPARSNDASRIHSFKPIGSITKVSPSHQPIESPIHVDSTFLSCARLEAPIGITRKKCMYSYRTIILSGVLIHCCAYGDRIWRVKPLGKQKAVGSSLYVSPEGFRFRNASPAGLNGEKFFAL